MNKHTPAPWTIREVAGQSIPGQRAFAIDFNEDQEQVVDWVYEQADAHLIAAAPDLLEALERCERLLRSKRHACEDSNLCRVLDSHISQARTAIAKARGEA